MSFFRYPGGKKKLSKQIVGKLLSLRDNNNLSEYREPFFGGGSVGIAFLEAAGNLIQTVHINDKDDALAMLWTMVISYPDQLKDRVMNFSPSVDNFYKFKKELIEGSTLNKTQQELWDLGFKKLAIHQISYSGLGIKSGSPLGGIGQKSDYKIDCRWSPSYICKKIDKISSLLTNYLVRHGGCMSLDFSFLLNDMYGSDALVYVDPPYYVKGNDLYQESFSIQDHSRLASNLKSTRHSWLLSYDDCPEIRGLYDWAKIEEVDVNYTIKTSRNKRELFITKGE